MKSKLLKGLIAVLAIAPISVFASNAKTNINGVNISAQNYDRLKMVYTDEYIDTLTQEEYNKLINTDLENASTSDKYIKSIYNKITGESEDIEVSEEEYNNAGVIQSATEQTRSSYYETTYKRISLSITRSSTYTAHVSFATTWKGMPSVRSYDVNALRFVNMTKIGGTQSGKQIYTLNGTTSYVNYSYNGTNISNQTAGFGISMNLVDSSVSYLQCTIDVDVSIDAFAAAAFASYQHATTNVSLATSKTYTIASGGYGNVISFYSGVGSYYDGMQGVDYYIYS